MTMTNNTTATIFENISKAGAIAPTTLNGLPGMSSLEIAEATGKRHDHVLRGIKKMLKEVAPLLGRAIQYVETSYQDSQNKTQPLIVLDKELTFTVLTGYNATLRLLVNRRWLELEGSGFKRVSVQAAVVHLVERERCDWSAFKGLKRAPKRPLSPAEKEIKAAISKAKRYADKNPIR
ncbi:MAG: Rha family transcriptional regulator [Gammaproteobacteria bacterium]|nr:Rha family transcriptional regulator [Gammaproteobacteria bacterium]MBU0884411.1 Rha family transcriptional regulator [Gammaproteobacteria bacterium]MBU1859803.1 Rha family transcriptional regulator [Gammaproteobacteria bacterium]